MEYIDNSLDEESLAFNNMKEQILRRVLIDEDRNKLFIIPQLISIVKLLAICYLKKLYVKIYKKAMRMLINKI